jgi:uncharacterized protein YuzE
MIKTSYDPEADAMFIWLAPEGVKSTETREVEPGIILDFGVDGRLVGIEVLDVKKRVDAHSQLHIADQSPPMSVEVDPSQSGLL